MNEKTMLGITLGLMTLSLMVAHGIIVVHTIRGQKEILKNAKKKA